MVIGALSKGISIAAPIIGRYALRYGRAESRVFNRLYGTARGRGVRHGLAAGGVAGTFIKSDNGIVGDAEIPFKRNGPKASKPYKTRSRFKRNSRSRCNCRVPYRKRY